jgi:hypothetical protein
MAVRLLTTKIVTKHFKRAHSDRYIGLKVSPKPFFSCPSF